MKRRTVVTGGAGFVGKHLVTVLREHGEEVCSFDLAAPSHPDDVQGSVNDREALGQAFDGADTVFHLAGNAQLWAPDQTVFDQVNRQGTECAVEAALRAGVNRFVHCSSLTTLVSRHAPIGVSHADESVRLNPDDMLGAYPRSKLEAERIVESATDLNTVIVLPTEPLGPGDDSLTPPTQMILDFVNCRTPAYIDCILNFVPVHSLAMGMIAARDKAKRGERYLLGGENTPMRDLLGLIEDHSGVATPNIKMPYAVALAAGFVDTQLVARFTGKPPKAPLSGVRLAGRQISFSSEKAGRDLGWRSESLEPALAATIKWFEETGLRYS